jgi:hypothetical protein
MTGDRRARAIEAAREAWHGAIDDIPAAVVDAVTPIIEEQRDAQWRQWDATLVSRTEAEVRERIAKDVRLWCDHELVGPCGSCRYIAKRIEENL